MAQDDRSVASDSQAQPHVSEMTLKALVERHGWQASAGDDGGVEKSFPGMAPADGLVRDGGRMIYAGYRFDNERRRYIAAVLDGKELLDIDGRGRDPVDVARELNARVEVVVAHERALTGYKPEAISPAIALSQLIDAVKAGSQERVEALLRDRSVLSVLDSRDVNGFTVLHHAAIANERRLVELLIAAGADTQIKTPGGMGYAELRALSGLSQNELFGPQAMDLLKLRTARAAQDCVATEASESTVAASSTRRKEGDAVWPEPGQAAALEEDFLTIKKIAGAGPEDEGEGLIKQGVAPASAETAKPHGSSAPRALLDGLFVGNDAGEYTRIGQSKVALIDAGAQITLKNREIETFRASIELVKAKGWTSIEVGGAKRYRQAAWLEARVQGLEVQGYEPTQQDLQVLEQRLADKTLQESIAAGKPDVVSKSLVEAQSMALAFKKTYVAPNLRNGSYSGQVFAQSSHHVLVTVDGRAKTATAIEKAKLKDVKYQVGHVLDVKFQDGALVPGRGQAASAKVSR